MNEKRARIQVCVGFIIIDISVEEDMLSAERIKDNQSACVFVFVLCIYFNLLEKKSTERKCQK